MLGMLQQRSFMQTRAGPAPVLFCAAGWSQQGKNAGFSMASELVGKALTEGSFVVSMLGTGQS